MVWCGGWCCCLPVCAPVPPPPPSPSPQLLFVLCTHHPHPISISSFCPRHCRSPSTPHHFVSPIPFCLCKFVVLRVAHTVNPATGSRDEIVVQLVVGLGESLVANHTGRPLGGVIRRESLEAALDEALGREPAAWQQHGSSNGYDEYDTGISSAHASTEEEMLFPGGLTQLEAERQQHSTGGGGRFGAFFQRLGGHASGHGPVRREAISSSRVRSSGGGGRFAAYLDSVGRGGAARSGAAASSTPPTPARGELLAAVDVASFPSKEAAVVPAGMVLPGHGGGRGGEYGNITFMARSDSNAEDLPG